jgi:hypothetical protein
MLSCGSGSCERIGGSCSAFAAAAAAKAEVSVACFGGAAGAYSALVGCRAACTSFGSKGG